MSKQIAFRADEELQDILNTYASEHNCTITQAIKDLILNHAKEQNIQSSHIRVDLRKVGKSHVNWTLHKNTIHNLKIFADKRKSSVSSAADYAIEKGLKELGEWIY